MNKEIKEILQKIENVVNHKEASYNALVETKAEDYKSLLDYITNLQQENERLKAIWKDTNVIIKDDKTLVMNTNAYDCLEDYKSRCEKAIELYKNCKEEDWCTLPIDMVRILQNGSDADV